MSIGRWFKIWSDVCWLAGRRNAEGRSLHFFLVSWRVYNRADLLYVSSQQKNCQSHRLSTELYFKTHNDDEKVNPAPLYNTNQECKREVPFKHSKFTEKVIHTPKPEYGHRYHLRLIKPDPINLIARKHEVDSLLRVLPDLSRSIAEDVVERAHEVGRALIRVFNTKVRAMIICISLS